MASRDFSSNKKNKKPLHIHSACVLPNTWGELKIKARLFSVRSWCYQLYRSSKT